MTADMQFGRRPIHQEKRVLCMCVYHICIAESYPQFLLYHNILTIYNHIKPQLFLNFTHPSHCPKTLDIQTLPLILSFHPHFTSILSLIPKILSPSPQSYVYHLPYSLSLFLFSYIYSCNLPNYTSSHSLPTIILLSTASFFFCYSSPHPISKSLLPPSIHMPHWLPPPLIHYPLISLFNSI